MSIDNANADVTPLFVEFRPGMRKRIAGVVEALIDVLDQISGDDDAEEDDPAEDGAPCEDVGDGEPSLGWTGHGRGHPEMALRGYDEDRENDDEREADPAEDGIGDMDGFIEQSMRYRE